jgi:Prokaryotic Cytochrome C oxidase subunit IV
VSAAFNKRLMIVWLVLSSLTLAYLWMDNAVDDDGMLRPSTVVTTGAIVIALIKVRIIFREFMEVRHAPVLLRRLTDAWVLIMGVCLLGSYFIGMAVS